MKYEEWRSMMNKTQSQGRECLYVLGTSVSHLWTGNNGNAGVDPGIRLSWSMGIRTMSTWRQMFSASCRREVGEISMCVSVSIRNWEKGCSETKLKSWRLSSLTVAHYGRHIAVLMDRDEKNHWIGAMGSRSIIIIVKILTHLFLNGGLTIYFNTSLKENTNWSLPALLTMCNSFLIYKLETFKQTQL